MQEHEAAIAALAIDPLRFVAICWPSMQLYDKQRDVLLSVRDNLETFVHAANELGKTRIAAVAAIWWFASRTPARVITSSSSETQLKSILWSEINSLIQQAALPLPFRVTTLSVEKLKAPGAMETEPLDYLIGHVTNAVENFQGHHLPNDRPRVLAIFDEASGIPDDFYDAADSWADRKLVIGNPLSTSNFFYKKCKAGDVADPAGGRGLLRKVIHISGRDSPNVRAALRWREVGQEGQPPLMIPGLLSHDDYVRREREWDEVKKTTRLFGKFYEGSQAKLFPPAWLDLAMDGNHWLGLQRRQRQVQAIGVDVAGGGRDNSVWTLIDRHGVIEQIVENTPNTMTIPGRTIALIRDHKLDASQVAIDVGGLGKGVCDRLWEQGYRIHAINFGESAGKKETTQVVPDRETDPKKAFKNRRAEMYGMLRERMEPPFEDDGEAARAVQLAGTWEPFALPPDAYLLREELGVLPLQYDSEGRLFLPPKDPGRAKAAGFVSIQSLLGRSPDRADSLVLAIFALKHGRPKQQFAWGGTLSDWRTTRGAVWQRGTTPPQIWW